MTATWQPYREPLRSTLVRTVGIAVVVGGLLAPSLGGMSRWPVAALLVLWPSFGGHWVDLFFLNWLRPRIPVARGGQVGARLAVWFVGGVGLMYGMLMTATGLARFARERWPAWWVGGLVFIGVELIAQLALHMRGRPSFYNGRG